MVVLGCMHDVVPRTLGGSGAHSSEDGRKG